MAAVQFAHMVADSEQIINSVTLFLLFIYQILRHIKRFERKIYNFSDFSRGISEEGVLVFSF